MFPIQSHTVHFILQYISPPSLLTQSLPLHLLSKPLLQRHHFLQISPDTPVEYLCWPAPHSARAIELLDNFLTSTEDPDEYSVRYTSDAEHTYAHVQVVAQDEGVRMLFQWDDQDGWKYHDTQLMPFPPTSRPTLEQATAESYSADEVLEQAVSAASTIAADPNSEDDYWNAYGVPSEDLISALPPRNARDDSSDGEDAYWAQYSSVQGSADSTVPSPLPNNQKLQPAPPAYYTQDEGTIPIPVDAIHSLPLGDSKFDPPSPTTLTNLLKIISPRKDTHPPTSDEPPSAFDRDTPSPLSTVDNSDLVTPVSANMGQYAHVIPPVKVKLNDTLFSNGQHARNGHGDGDEAVVEEDKALTESIKGIYCLWKARKWKQADKESSDTFLHIVRTAITQP
ncbi:hypothetical protein AZE42_01268 [Rhizopogon vesiculosus]|uniref:Uncharacterized protein n=1 Tax=Rhizopogon vesiculosus TaxID=180088 RepID=A0A1J8R480_9AGAM|nr:hypothetical protein AZE42_01268 [Rhizopogon vesiculosus]